MAFYLARRELRLGIRGLRLALAALALGVASIAAVGGLRDGVDAGLAAQSRQLIGGDLVVSGGTQPLPAALVQFLRARGARLSQILRTRTLLRTPAGGHLLVSLQAVDAGWPLVGQVALDPAQGLKAALAAQDGVWGLAADPLVLHRLGLKPGAMVQLGEERFTLRGALLSVPDRVTNGLNFGPTVVIAAAALPATHLLQPGALAQYSLRATLPPGGDAAALREAIQARFPTEAWRIRIAADGPPGVGRFLEQAGFVLGLTGLAALLVGGIGVAMGVRGWLESRARSIAILRCLGASARLVFMVYLLQVLAIAVLGIAIGLVAGAVLPAAGLAAFADWLPAPPRIGLYPGPLLRAGIEGLLVSALFALWPLARAARTAPAGLFRGPGAIVPSGRIGPRMGIALSVPLGLLLATALWRAPDPGFTVLFFAVAGVTAALFWMAGLWVGILAGMVPRPRHAGLRLGLGALAAPGAPNAVILTALGLGLTVLATLGSVQAGLDTILRAQVPALAPNLFLLDIQPPELDRLRGLLAPPAVVSAQMQPMLVARVVAVDGVAADRIDAAEDTRWALRSDRGLTWSARPPAGTDLVAGHWWAPDYRGPPLVSLDAALARGWHTALGGSITVNVAGRPIVMRIASLRRIDWRSGGLNFTMVASPGLLSGAPHSLIAAVHTHDAAATGALLDRLARDFPTITPIDVAAVLADLGRLFARMAAGVGAAGALALVAGGLVMAGAIAATRARRAREAVLLRVLGASGRQIRLAWAVEFLVLGLVAGLLAAMLGLASAWAVLHFALHLPVALPVGRGVLIVVGALVAAVPIGLLASEAALHSPPARWLREPG